MNNGKYQSEQYLRLQSEKNDRRYGPTINHNKVCETCQEPFTWFGRLKTKAFAEARFCGRSCANSIGGKALSVLREEAGIANYVTLCKRYHPWRCVVCGEERIVEVHHHNGNHSDNSPTNLVPLCPTHHQYVHSKHRNLVSQEIDEYVREFGGLV